MENSLIRGLILLLCATSDSGHQLNSVLVAFSPPNTQFLAELV